VFMGIFLVKCQRKADVFIFLQLVLEPRPNRCGFLNA
jgi:hypothetical protein